jgi:hypothetical protein
VGAQELLNVYGLLSAQAAAAAPALSPGTESFSGTASVTMSDATAGATIYYTLDGSTPTISSTVYTAPISLSATTTINAMATASGYDQSATTTATYTLSTQVATPTFNPGSGTITQPTSVTINDSTSGATIYYTTDGSTPTTASTPYTGPVSVNATETLSAIAAASGDSNSNVGSATYTLASGQTGINFPIGFAETQGILILNGVADLDDSRLQMTDGGTNEASSAWYYQPVNIQAFNTTFSFQLSNPAGNGITFAIQGNGTSSLGNSGSGLGFQAIPNSVAIKFDFNTIVGPAHDSTGLYTDGALPTVPAIDLSTTGINLLSDDLFDVAVAYNGTFLSMTITDTVTGAAYSTSWTVNIPSIVGGNTAYVGFTGGAGTTSSSQKLLTWVYTTGSTAAPVSTTPMFSPPGATFSTAQTVTLSSLTAGAQIYYTTNGTTPTPSSTLYSTPLTVSSTDKVKAIAIAPGYSASTVGVATYTIYPVLPTPSLAPGGGTYTTAQTVTISDAMAGATIYYTTNGTVPTTSSSVYTGAITVGATETVQAMAVERYYTNSAAATATYAINPVLPTPYIAPGGGTYTTPQTMTISDATSGTTIYFTTDGTTPTTSSSVYTGPATVNAPETVNAIAVKTGFTNSALATATYTFSSVAAPVFSVAGGTYTAAQPVSISDSTAGAKIYYTTNGSTPTTGSALYTRAVNVLQSETLSAIAVNSASVQSPVTQASYTINPPAATPAFAPSGGHYSTTQSVTINELTPNATLYYTTNGTVPTTSSTQYTGAISVSSSETLEAIAVAPNYSQSKTITAVYVFPAATPVLSLASGTYATAQSVTISDATPGASIYYTLDGSNPTTSSTLYTGAITVSATETIKAAAFAPNDSQSSVALAPYAITP